MSLTEKAEWFWWVGYSEDEFHTKCNSRDEAVREAIDMGGAYICEARQEPVKLSDYFEAGRFVELANDRYFDDLSNELDKEGPFSEIKTKQLPELQERVRMAIDTWQMRYGLQFIPWVFSEYRHKEYIPEGYKPSKFLGE